MKNLLSMVDFVFEQQKNHLSLRDFNITNYANFLKQPLELWMFVPCDEDGNALEEPNECNCNGHTEYCGGCINTYPGVKYQQAKERCLFDVVSEKDAKFVLFANETIEDLIDFNLQLTPTAQKQIGL